MPPMQRSKQKRFTACSHNEHLNLRYVERTCNLMDARVRNEFAHCKLIEPACGRLCHGNRYAETEIGSHLPKTPSSDTTKTMRRYVGKDARQGAVRDTVYSTKLLGMLSLTASS